MAKLIDVVKESLAAGGIEDAVGVNVTFKDGTRLNIISDAAPELSREVDDGEVVDVKPVPSAGAGARGDERD